MYLYSYIVYSNYDKYRYREKYDMNIHEFITNNKITNLPL